ncbi:hypothetical protein ACW5CM_06380 [Microbacterium sp. A588]
MVDEHRLTDVDIAALPWPLLIEVVEATPPHSWVLMGGMMTHLHALRGRVSAARPTTDVDVLLNLQAIAADVSAVVGPLQRLGMRPVEPSGPFHRFTRGEDVVDIMVTNLAGRARWMSRPIMRAPGATLALQDPDVYIVEADGRDVRIAVPRTPAALVLKAAAFKNDQRDRGRHLEDIVVLLAADTNNPLKYSSIPTTQRRHLRPAVDHLADIGHPAWQILDEHDRELARRAFETLVQQT